MQRYCRHPSRSPFLGLRPRTGSPSHALMLAALMACGVWSAATRTADARPTSVGYYAEAGLGATVFFGNGAKYAAPGPSLEIRMGYDLFSWLSVGAVLGLSTHEATVPPPPEGEYFQLYSGMADARVGIPVGRFHIFADAGLGLAGVSSNVLEQVDILEPGQSASFAIRAGGGIEYQLQNRHYAFGVGGQWMNMPNFASLQGVSARLYLRYTY